MSEPSSDLRAAWAAAFIGAQAEFPEIPKTKTATIQMRGGGSFSYKYADLPAILAAIKPALIKHQLGVAQSVESRPEGIGIVTRIYHLMGHVEEFGPVVLPAGEDARAAGSATTYARRYGLCAALGIAADEDDDGASAPKRKSPPKGKQGPGVDDRVESGSAEAHPSGEPERPAPSDFPQAGEPATSEHWERAQSLGLTAAKALQAAHKRWPDVKTASEITSGQLAELMAEAMPK